LINSNNKFNKKENIQIKRFDDLKLSINKTKIKFIKIDIEGFEYEAIK
jgi:FkbM family methyltransferase